MSLLSRLAVQAARGFGALSVSNKVSVDFLIVAGGGSGGVTSNAGGGGAGGFRTSAGTSGRGAAAESKLILSTAVTYSILVGAGGAGTSTTNANGNQGSSSSISGTGLVTVTATGGGYGGGSGSKNGGNGGSGGGGGYSSGLGGSGTAGQGYDGGGGSGAAPAYSGGGGGGAGQAGGVGSGTAGSGVGGNGQSSSISGASVTYAGGGGASNDTATIQGGGTGGGGAGGTSGSLNGGAGTVNTGSGGGASWTNGSSGAGGSGIVIISYTSPTPLFVGGTITTSGGKQIHTFTSSGTLSPITPVTASYLVVAGGGGGAGASNGGGAGGAGGYQTSSTTLYSGATYVVTVGAGGTGGTSGTNGSDSVLSGTGITTVTSIGGGRANNNANGSSGGSGGGASSTNGTAYTGGAGTLGQGFAGGNSVSTSPFATGGGGGASAVGANGSGSQSGNGGAGTASSISGTSVTYAGGGGGGATSQGSARGTGGAGGGGDGGVSGSNGVSGTPNLGGGGGGGSNSGGIVGGNGGSGIVIISYAGSQQFNGGLVTTSGGNTIHTFTSTGALTPLTNNLNNSLRFRSSASANLSRTPTLAGSRTTWTFSVWTKLGALSAHKGLFERFVSATEFHTLAFTNTNVLRFYSYINPTDYGFDTTAVFRDPSAWYHVVAVFDTTNATAADRMRLYVNGNRLTAFSVDYASPTQNYEGGWNAATLQSIGRYQDQAAFADCYMAEINFIDGQALEPYYFGNNDANGVWKPIQYRGTYGTNGFYLKFNNTASTTTLGYDSSPNSNNWTCANISLTAGTTYDAMTDVPTNTSANVANYCTLNPLRNHANNAITNGSLSVAFNDGTASRTTFSTFGVTSGKWYWEMTVTSIGITYYPATGVNTNLSLLPSDQSGSDAAGYMYVANGQKLNNATLASYGNSYTTNDVIGVALDMDAGTITFYKNNTSQGQAYSGITGTAVPCFIGANGACAVNFGQRPFTYTPPTGHVALNTFNLPTPTILQGNKYMDATTYTASGTSQVIVNQGQFKPDFLWTKTRGVSGSHYVMDSVRGPSKYLHAQANVAEMTDANYITSFNNNGFSIGSSNYSSGTTMVAWQWQAGQGTTVSNTSGTITSNVSVSTTAGLSIVTYTGTGANATVGHGLGITPSMIVIKSRSGISDWATYHTSVGNTKALFLNRDIAENTSISYWQNSSPTSSVFSVGYGADVNPSGANLVAFCFATISGFSAFGSYAGNGSTDGPFVYTGFRPKWIVWKRTDSSGYDWDIYDSSRDTYNLAFKEIIINSSAAESDSTVLSLDILSNGFKLRTSNANGNASGGTYIYAAFAEHPFKNANAR